MAAIPSRCGPLCCSIAIDASIVVITSPARSHPSTEIIWSVLETLPLLGGLAEAPILVVCDGCRAASELETAHAERVRPKLERDPCALSKRGIVRDDIARNYVAFQARLAQEAAAKLPRRLSLLQLESHHGFALAVREGLRATQTRFALVVQHDRAFIRSIDADDLRGIAAHFDSQPSCRYVGFPSGTSKNLAARTASQYKLHSLLEQRTYTLRPHTPAEEAAALPAKVDAELRLRPSIFWYDSNHLVDCARALQIYEPFRHAPPQIHARLGAAGVGRLRLRRGDFIEERFGVEQRNLLARRRVANRRAAAPAWACDCTAWLCGARVVCV